LPERNLLNLNDIHIIPLTGIRFFPQQSPGGPEFSGMANRPYYSDVVEGFRFKLGVSLISQNSISQGPEERED
jgi:hypothetical protein